MENDYTMGTDKLPKTVNKAFDILLHYKNNEDKKKVKTNKDQNKNNNNSGKTGLNLNNQVVERVPILDWHKNATCHCCGKKGHIRLNYGQLPQHKQK